MTATITSTTTTKFEHFILLWTLCKYISNTDDSENVSTRDFDETFWESVKEKFDENLKVFKKNSSIIQQASPLSIGAGTAASPVRSSSRGRPPTTVAQASTDPSISAKQVYEMWKFIIEKESLESNLCLDSSKLELLRDHIQYNLKVKIRKELQDLELEHLKLSNAAEKIKVNVLLESAASADQIESPVSTKFSEFEGTDLESNLGDGERSTKSRKSGSRPTTWQRTALMIFGKIADHKAGPAFLKTIKDPHYSKIVKSPLFLDNVKARIRNKTINTTAEFHRDVMRVLANCVMFYPADSEMNSLALEMMDFVDEEMQNFLLSHPAL